jgi:MFS family permease
MFGEDRRWLVVIGSLVGLIVGSGSIKIFAFSILLKPTVEAIGISRSEIGLAFLIGNIFAMACTPIYGRLIDLYGIRVISVPAITAWSATMAAFALLSPAHSWLIYPLYILSGIFSVAQTPLPYSKAVVSWFKTRRGLALGIAISGVGLGGLLMPQYVQLVSEHFGWRWAYVAVGAAIFLVAVPMMATIVRERPGLAAAESRSQKTPIMPVIREAMAKHQFWSLAFIFFFAVTAINGLLTHLAALLTDRGIDKSFAADALSVAGGAVILGRLLSGYLLDKFPGPYVASVMFLIPAASFLGLAWSSSPLLLIVGALGMGLGVGAEVDILGYLTSRYFGVASYGVIYGVLFSLVTAATAFGPFAIGLLYQTSGSYYSALLLAAVILGVSAIISLFLGKYPENE